MKTRLTLLLLFASTFSHTIFSQNSVGTALTWMKGDNTVNQTGVYGTKGVSEPGNEPGARDYAATWSDKNGTLWMFGGYGYDETAQGYLNDLWKYNPDNNQWTWIKGDKNINSYAVYGTKGTAHVNNKPGSNYASVYWTDNDGNLWLFGGFGYTANDIGLLNDLWKYDPVTNNWTWMKGDKTIDRPAIYGTTGVPNINNRPGARYGSKTWTDAVGNLWLYGGYGLDAANSGMLNDLWKYEISTNRWTFVKGDKAIDKAGVYGQKNVSSASNKPGARYLGNAWTDKQGNFWLFGGYGYDEATTGSLNDLWKYNPTTNTWTWENGSKQTGAYSSYGSLGVAHSGNQPGARYMSVSWIDDFGDLLLFGGYGLDESKTGYLNDLWQYDIATGTWTWVKGDNMVDQAGVYGTQGVISHTNKSGARNSCISWADDSGNLWMFGGYGFAQSETGVLNDLWKITQLIVLPLNLLEFNGTLNNDVARLQWKTAQEESFSHFNVERSFDGSNFSTISRVNGIGGASENNYTLNDPLNSHSGTTVFYRLQMVHANGEMDYSKIIRLERSNAGTEVRLFPNPAKNAVSVSFNLSRSEKIAMRISDSKGAMVYNSEKNCGEGYTSMTIDVSKYTSGVYYLSVVFGNEIKTLKLIVN